MAARRKPHVPAPQRVPAPAEVEERRLDEERRARRMQRWRAPATTPSSTIRRIVEDYILGGAFRIPAFQRGLVWSDADVIALLDSIRRGFHVGMPIVWEQYKLPASIPCLADATPPADGRGFLIVDGQQRLAALHAAFCSGRFSYDFDSEKFVVDREPAPRVLPLAWLRTGEQESVMAWVNSGGDAHDYGDLIEELVYRDLPIVLLPTQWTIAEVTEMFRRLNTAGIRMSADEIARNLRRALG